MPSPPHHCSLHGPGLPPHALVGRQLDQIHAAWYLHDGKRDGSPLDVWLIDGDGESVHITTGPNWCPIVETAPPHAGWAYDDLVVSVEPGGTLLAPHIGERITAAHEEHHPYTGRMAVELTSPTGKVRCDSRAGDLRLLTPPA